MAAIFGGINTPYINEATLKRVMSNVAKSNIFQGIFARPEEAATEKFSTDTDAAEIQVIRVKPNDGMAREIGADVNGAFFNADDARTSTTEAYGIKILTTIDYNVDIPTNLQNMINVDVAEAELSNLTGKVATNVNAVTLAAHLAKWLTYDANSTTDGGNKVQLAASPADGAYRDALIDANSFLDSGNESEGIQTYPRENRAFIFRSTMNANLKKGGNIIVGGSNFGQIMVKTGALDSDTKLENVLGYVGDVDGTPCYVASNPVWYLVERYLGLAKGDLDSVLGVAVCAVGTGRALAFQDSVKIIPAPSGQGIRIQPKYRMGAECWDALSVVPIVTNDFENPVAEDTTLTNQAPASRTFKVSYDKNGGTGTVAGSTNLKYGAKVTLPAAGQDFGFTGPSGKTAFKGWGLTADTTAAKAIAGGTEVTVQKDLIYYAIWGAT